MSQLWNCAEDKAAFSKSDSKKKEGEWGGEKRCKNVENVVFADYLMLGELHFPFVFCPLYHQNLACFPPPAGITNTTSLYLEAWTLP